MVDRYETYGWRPDTTLSEDENYMDLVLLITRSSTLTQGSMACLLVQATKHTEEIEDLEMMLHHYQSRVVSAAINRSLYKPDSSDIHAEIHAIGMAARHGHATDGCTAYITMPPCRNCLAALLMAGVKRIVSRYTLRDDLAEIARMYGVEVDAVENHVEQRARIDSIVQSYLASKAEESEED
jgi:deoxycytidylate deaminase